MDATPEIVLFAGPNGAGKSTFARFALPEAMPFVNADEIAKTLPEGFTGNPEIEAGRLLIARVEQLTARRASFALETTLASRSLAPRIAGLQKAGYQLRLLFLWLPSADLARARVAARVRRGGHAIPDATIARRFETGLQNFFTLYRPLADNWFMFDNTRLAPPQLIARGGRQMETVVRHFPAWAHIQKQGVIMNMNACRVCGYIDPDGEPPWGENGDCPTYDFCDCCGTEFGVEDCDYEPTKRYRHTWLRNGANWYDPNGKPADWNIVEQLEVISPDEESLRLAIAILQAPHPSLFADPDELTRRFGVAVREALLDHKRAQNSVAVWGDNGKVALVPPDAITTKE